MQNKKLKNNLLSGFTIIELIVVIAIIAVLAGIVIFAVTQYIAKAKDATIEGDLVSIAKDAAVIFSGGSGNYGELTSNLIYQNISSSINNAGGVMTVNVPSDNSEYCVASTLVTDKTKSWCVDNTGFNGIGFCSSAGSCAGGYCSGGNYDLGSGVCSGNYCTGSYYLSDGTCDGSPQNDCSIYNSDSSACSSHPECTNALSCDNPSSGDFGCASYTNQSNCTMYWYQYCSWNGNCNYFGGECSAWNNDSVDCGNVPGCTFNADTDYCNNIGPNCSVSGCDENNDCGGLSADINIADCSDPNNNECTCHNGCTWKNDTAPCSSITDSGTCSDKSGCSWIGE